jgi:hypothetical protein
MCKSLIYFRLVVTGYTQIVDDFVTSFSSIMEKLGNPIPAHAISVVPVLENVKLDDDVNVNTLKTVHINFNGKGADSAGLFDTLIAPYPKNTIHYTLYSFDYDNVVCSMLSSAAEDTRDLSLSFLEEIITRFHGVDLSDKQLVLETLKDFYGVMGVVANVAINRYNDEDKNYEQMVSFILSAEENHVKVQKRMRRASLLNMVKKTFRPSPIL